MISDIVINYGNHTLTEKMDLVEVPDFGLLPNVENLVTTSAHSDGSKFRFNKLSSKIITFKFLLSSGDAYSYRDELNHMLMQSDPQLLKINIFPDRYWNAVIDGDTSFVRDMDQLHEAEVLLSFLIPDGVARSIDEKRSTNHAELNATADFIGKTMGSVAENPHVAKWSGDKTLRNPNSSNLTEFDQNKYSKIDATDGHTSTVQTTTNGAFAQVLFSFDLITDIDLMSPGLFESLGATTLDQKVAAARIAVDGTIHPIVYASGSGASATDGSRNQANIQIYGTAWHGGALNTTNKIVALEYMNQPGGRIQDDGFVYVIAYAPTSNGIIPSTLNIDYACLKYTLNYNSNYVDVINNGTYKSYPILEAKMSSDNGFVGFINQDGAILQFGNPDEPDTVDYIESDRVVWDTSMVADKENSRGWKTNMYQFSELWLGKHKLNANGTRVFGSNASLKYVQAGSYGTGSSGYKGITYGRKVSPDSQGYVGARDFESRHGVWFESGTVKQTGLFLTELRDKNGKQVCSVAFYKLSSSTNDARIRINVRNNIQEFKFEPSAWNAFTKMGKEFSILKTGSKLTFRLGNASDSMIIFSMDIDSVKEAEVTDIVYYIGVPISGTPLTRMYLTRSTLRKDNVDKIRDIKNVFGEGDTLTIDTRKGQASVNGIEIFGLGALGNEYEAFTLKPGKNKIQCINSDWVKNPVEYTIKWRDAYL